MNLAAFGDAINTGMVNGKLNAVPVSYTARFYLWQKTSFDKAGIAIPKTWDDLFAAGKVFETKLGKEFYPIDGQLYDVILMAHAYMMQKTGKQWIDPKQPKVAFNRAEALEFVKIYKKLAETHVVTPLQYRLSVSGPEAPTEQQQEWIKGNWAGNYTWDSTFNTRVKTLPKTTVTDVGDFITMKGAKSSGFFGRPSMMFAVSKHAKKPLIAAKFIDFMLNNPAAIKVLGTSRGAPMSKIGFDQLSKDNVFKPIDVKAINQVRKAKVDAPSAYFESNKMQEHVRSIFEAVSLGKSTDEEAVNRLTTETDQVLRNISK
jgi:oligogalacturonide transport system substrate-binding protein